MATIRQFVAANHITMSVDWADENPHMEDSANMNHFRCVIRRNAEGKRTQMTVLFSQGYGISREPRPTDVLDCLASDASGAENARSFEDWADEYGYDTDSRKAERIYRTVQQQARKLRNFLGDDAYEALLWNTERE